MKKLSRWIIVFLIASSPLLCFSQVLTIAQVKATLHKDASQATNYLTMKGYNFYKSVDSAGVKGLIFTYRLNRDSGKDQAHFWFDLFYTGSSPYSAKFTFSEHSIYSNFVKQLELLKAKKIDEKIGSNKIESIYFDSSYIYMLSTITREDTLPFTLEIQFKVN